MSVVAQFPSANIERIMPPAQGELMAALTSFTSKLLFREIDKAEGSFDRQAFFDGYETLWSAYERVKGNPVVQMDRSQIQGVLRSGQYAVMEEVFQP